MLRETPRRSAISGNVRWVASSGRSRTSAGVRVSGRPWSAVSCTAATARQAEEIERRRPGLGDLPDKVATLVAAAQEAAQHGLPDTLTPAEVRLLPLLATHLTFPLIAERLGVSRNTVKTQAISTYRKLGVTSRNEAVARWEVLDGS